MQNEFYEVTFESFANGRYFFKDKDKAFDYLWERFLSVAGDKSDEYLADAFEEMNYYYGLDGFGRVNVCGFED